MTPGRVYSPALLVLLSSLTVAMLCPAPVRAGCSAHALRTNGQAVSSVSLVPLDRLLAVQVDPSEDLPLQPRPCTGAFCSGSPAPASATPSVVTPPATDWACSARPDVLPGDTGLQALPDAARLRPTHRPGSVFHPPR